MQEKTKEKELEIKERELQQKLAEKNSEPINTEQKNKYFEIKVLSGSSKVTYSNENINEKDSREIIESIISVLSSSKAE